MKNWRYRREELEGSERGQVGGCVWGWLRRQCGCIACLFGALVTLHGYAVRRVSLKSWLDLFSLKAGVLFRVIAWNGCEMGVSVRVLVFI